MRNDVQRHSTLTCPTKNRSLARCKSMFKTHHCQSVQKNKSPATCESMFPKSLLHSSRENTVYHSRKYSVSLGCRTTALEKTQVRDSLSHLLSHFISDTFGWLSRTRNSTFAQPSETISGSSKHLILPTIKGYIVSLRCWYQKPLHPRRIDGCPL